jgi:hypothetical protein
MNTILLNTYNIDGPEMNLLLVLMMPLAKSMHVDDIIVVTNRYPEHRIYSVVNGGKPSGTKIINVSFPSDMLSVEKERFLGVLEGELKKVAGDTGFSVVA